MSTPGKQYTYKPKSNVIVDTETLALDSKAAIVDIGAVLGYGKFQGQPDFHIKIKPSSYAGTMFEIDAETIQWHNTNKPGYLADLEATGVSFQEAAAVFNEWLAGFAANSDLHMWAQGKDFDQSVLSWLFKQCGIKPAYSYRNFHCTRDLLYLNPGARIQNRSEAEHTALADAQGAADQFNAIVAKSDWYKRLFS